MRRKWSPASKVFGALAVVFAVAAFGVVRGYAARVEALAPDLGRSVTVLVASRHMARGTPLSADDLRAESLPTRFAPPGSIHEASGVAGRILVSDIAAGEVITGTRLASSRAGPIAALVPEGLRAFPVATSLPPGSVRAGDHVDVLATFAGGRPHTETVASGIEVLVVLTSAEGAGSLPGGSAAAGADVAGVDTGTQTLVLLVRPDQAEQLAYARAFADLGISVESAGDAGD
jgi:Flp pilus assembly protein CpaB